MTGQWSTQALASTAWSFATLRVANEPLLAAIAGPALRNIDDLRPQHIARFAWAFAARQVADQPLSYALAAAAVRRLGDFGPHELVDTVWSCSEVSLAHTPVLEALAASAIRMRHSAPFGSGELLAAELADCLWPHCGRRRPRRGRAGSAPPGASARVSVAAAAAAGRPGLPATGSSAPNSAALPEEDCGAAMAIGVDHASISFGLWDPREGAVGRAAAEAWRERCARLMRSERDGRRRFQG